MWRELAATVRSFAHMPLRISDRNSANNNEVSTFKYILPLIFEASSTNGAFFWRFYSK